MDIDARIGKLIERQDCHTRLLEQLSQCVAQSLDDDRRRGAPGPDGDAGAKGSHLDWRPGGDRAEGLSAAVSRTITPQNATPWLATPSHHTPSHHTPSHHTPLSGNSPLFYTPGPASPDALLRNTFSPLGAGRWQSQPDIEVRLFEYAAVGVPPGLGPASLVQSQTPGGAHTPGFLALAWPASLEGDVGGVDDRRWSQLLLQRIHFSLLSCPTALAAFERPPSQWPPSKPATGSTPLPRAESLLFINNRYHQIVCVPAQPRTRSEIDSRRKCVSPAPGSATSSSASSSIADEFDSAHVPPSHAPALSPSRQGAEFSKLSPLFPLGPSTPRLPAGGTPTHSKVSEKKKKSASILEQQLDLIESEDVAEFQWLLSQAHGDFSCCLMDGALLLAQRLEDDANFFDGESALRDDPLHEDTKKEDTTKEDIKKVLIVLERRPFENLPCYENERRVSDDVAERFHTLLYIKMILFVLLFGLDLEYLSILAFAFVLHIHGVLDPILEALRRVRERHGARPGNAGNIHQVLREFQAVRELQSAAADLPETTREPQREQREVEQGEGGAGRERIENGDEQGMETEPLMSREGRPSSGAIGSETQALSRVARRAMVARRTTEANAGVERRSQNVSGIALAAFRTLIIFLGSLLPWWTPGADIVNT